jgi:hypothetical protein
MSNTYYQNPPPPQRNQFRQPSNNIQEQPSQNISSPINNHLYTNQKEGVIDN